MKIRPLIDTMVHFNHTIEDRMHGHPPGAHTKLPIITGSLSIEVSWEEDAAAFIERLTTYLPPYFSDTSCRVVFSTDGNPWYDYQGHSVGEALIQVSHDVAEVALDSSKLVIDVKTEPKMDESTAAARIYKLISAPAYAEKSKCLFSDIDIAMMVCSNTCHCQREHEACASVSKGFLQLVVRCCQRIVNQEPWSAGQLVRPQLTSEEVARVRATFQRARLDKSHLFTTSAVGHVPVYGHDMIRLLPGHWINDDVLNAALLNLGHALRNTWETDAACLLAVTLFYTTLSTRGYSCAIRLQPAAPHTACCILN